MSLVLRALRRVESERALLTTAAGILLMCALALVGVVVVLVLVSKEEEIVKFEKAFAWLGGPET